MIKNKQQKLVYMFFSGKGGQTGRGLFGWVQSCFCSFLTCQSNIAGCF